MKKRKKNALRLGLLNIFFIAVCFVCMIPIIYVFSVSFNAQNSLLSTKFSIIPEDFTLRNYKAVLFDEPVLLWFKNTAIMSVATVVLSLVVAVPSAYAFSSFRFKGRKQILYILLILNAFPSILSMFAIYKILSSMQLAHTKMGLIIVYIGTMAIFGIWNMKGYFDTIPSGISEAATVDGANDYKLVTKIILPLAKPSIIVTAIMILIYVWNEYIFSIIFMTGSENYTLAAGLYSLQASEMSGSWPIFSAASLVVSFPILVIFFIFQKHMISGLTVGGVKG
ncbi:MAG: ABC transporter permease subunit [Herbinix sp.]|nr:ABC transporter permease subunit [Herbinix sp.]